MRFSFREVIRDLILNLSQFLHNLRDRPILVGRAGVDVAAGRDVVVVLGHLLARDDAAELLLFASTALNVSAMRTMPSSGM